MKKPSGEGSSTEPVSDAGLLHDVVREIPVVDFARNDLDVFPLPPRFVRSSPSVGELDVAAYLKVVDHLSSVAHSSSN